MKTRPIREVSVARQVGEFISDFVRPSLGTLRHQIWANGPKSRIRPSPKQLKSYMLWFGRLLAHYELEIPIRAG